MNRTSFLLVLLLVGGCGSESEEPMVHAQVMADALHAVMEADRTVYASQVAHHLETEEAVINTSEHWMEDGSLPLPAQMFRMGAELVSKNTDTFSYSLLSKWPVNKDNGPRSELEAAGLDSVARDQSRPFYGRETLDGVEYFTAVYADIADSPACVTCHNTHPDSPRNDFVLGETMGGVVIRIPLR
ncbi:MAG: DUF3365 domain-containing protein [Gemmatimonadetes bacterium]|nr:DUF3365 domain-containing protein [Gemmatimonadota bacterium]